LVAFLAEHVPLQHLYLNNNGLGPEAGSLVANALSRLHAKKEEARKQGQDVPYLETVICGRNRLEAGSMAAWANAFSLHNKVKEVKMVQNGIRPQGIELLLSAGLRHASEIRVLDLQDNTFTLKGAKALAKVAPGWTEISELGVGDSLLGNKGGIAVAKALGLGKNTKLEILRLQYNEIATAALKNVFEAAKGGLPALRKIELNGNKFDEEDESIIAFRDLFEDRKEKLAGDIVIEDDWGLDELDDLEEVDSEEEEEEEEDITVAEKAEKEIKEAEEAQAEPVSQKKDVEVDELTKKLEKTSI